VASLRKLKSAGTKKLSSKMLNVENNDSRSVEKQDKNFYNTFAPRDPRPLAF
jgi:hypothetical protein